MSLNVASSDGVSTLDVEPHKYVVGCWSGVTTIMMNCHSTARVVAISCSDVPEELPSPQYNASVLSDMRMVANTEFLVEKLANAPSLVEAIMLLKVWLRRRHLDRVSGSS